MNPETDEDLTEPGKLNFIIHIESTNRNRAPSRILVVIPFAQCFSVFKRNQARALAEFAAHAFQMWKPSFDYSYAFAFTSRTISWQDL